jgi:hypothetical protein
VLLQPLANTASATTTVDRRNSGAGLLIGIQGNLGEEWGDTNQSMQAFVAGFGVELAIA